MRTKVQFYTDLDDRKLIEDHLGLISGYNVQMEEVPDAPPQPGTEENPLQVRVVDEEE